VKFSAAGRNKTNGEAAWAPPFDVASQNPQASAG